MATLIGSLGAGAGLMYLFDPDRGRRRRALIRDQMIHTTHRAEGSLEKASRDVGNRARGVMARTRSAFALGGVSDDTLLARVRANLGHVVSHPRAICVDVHDRRVTLSGAALASEVDRLIWSALSIPGVFEVIDRLDVYNGHDRPPELQGRRRKYGRHGFGGGNWSPARRLIVSIAGGALAVYGASRRGSLGAALGVIGAGAVVGGLAPAGKASSKTPRMARSNSHHRTGSRGENYYYRGMSMADYPRDYDEGARHTGRYEEPDDRYGRRGRQHGHEDRGFRDRAGDEARQWFGDEESERRRMRGAGEYDSYERDYGREAYRQGRQGRQGSRGDVERRYGGYGREISRGDYGRESYYGSSSPYSDPSSGYGQRGYDYDRESGYGRPYGSTYRGYSEFWQVPGPYTGRGPRSYVRSDERISEEINERLQQHGQIDATYIIVFVTDGVVTLSGAVDRKLEKRLAEDVAESCSGVKDVRNELRVTTREQQQERMGVQTAAGRTQPSTQSEIQTG